MTGRCAWCGELHLPYGGEDVCQCGTTACCGANVNDDCDCPDRYDDDCEDRP